MPLTNGCYPTGVEAADVTMLLCPLHCDVALLVNGPAAVGSRVWPLLLANSNWHTAGKLAAACVDTHAFSASE